MVSILPQPDDVTCGPTALHAVYGHYGLDIDLHDLIEEVNALDDGGTLGVFLGLDALRRGFGAILYSYDLDMFDPTWAALSSDELDRKLEAQAAIKCTPRFSAATRAFQAFLREGGRILFEEPTRALLEQHLGNGQPVLAGLSATYLYGTMREYTTTDRRSVHDDLRGTAVGHFVVLGDMTDESVLVADPLAENPLADGHHYRVDVERLLRAILLGIVTYDANILVISPPEEG